MITAPTYHFPISAIHGLCARISFLFVQGTPLFLPSGDRWIRCREEKRREEKRREEKITNYTILIPRFHGKYSPLKF